MKTKRDKKVNQVVRKLNKQLRKDVFGDRFYVRQVRKTGCIDCPSYHYYLYEFVDTKCPERNRMEWVSESCVLISMKVHSIMNEFIISSDFWSTFDRHWFDGKCICHNCHQYRQVKIKKEKIEEMVDGKSVFYIAEVVHCQKCGNTLVYHFMEDVNERNNVRREEALNHEYC